MRMPVVRVGPGARVYERSGARRLPVGNPLRSRCDPGRGCDVRVIPRLHEGGVAHVRADDATRGAVRADADDCNAPAGLVALVGRHLPDAYAGDAASLVSGLVQAVLSGGVPTNDQVQGVLALILGYSDGQHKSVECRDWLRAEGLLPQWGGLFEEGYRAGRADPVEGGAS